MTITSKVAIVCFVVSAAISIYSASYTKTIVGLKNELIDKQNQMISRQNRVIVELNDRLYEASLIQDFQSTVIQWLSQKSFDKQLVSE